MGKALLLGLHVPGCWFGGRAHLYGHLRRVTPGEGNRLGWDESRQVNKLQMDAVARMNSLEGVGETVSNPQFQSARLKEPLDNDQEKTGKDDTELISPEDALVSSNFGQTSTQSRDILSPTTREKCSLGPRSGTCSVGRVGEEPWVTHQHSSRS